MPFLLYKNADFREPKGSLPPAQLGKIDLRKNLCYILNIIVLKGVVFMEKKRVKLNICGSDYVIISEDNEDYIKSIGEKVSNKISENLENNSKISVTMAAVLTSLDFCDMESKCNEKLNELNHKMKDRESFLINKSKEQEKVFRREIEAQKIERC